MIGVSTWSESLVTGVVASLCASVVFFLALLVIRPRIQISPSIARTREGQYKLKLVNHSRRAAADVRVQMFISRQSYSVDGKPVHKLTYVPLKLSDGVILVLPGRRRKDKDHRYARRVVVDAELDGLWPDHNDNSLAVVRVFCRDSVSGFARQRERTYTRALVQPGDFEGGKSMTIKPTGATTP